MDIDSERNWYSYRGFKYLAKIYRNWKIAEQERRLKNRDNLNNENNSNLNEEENLIVLD